MSQLCDRWPILRYRAVRQKYTIAFSLRSQWFGTYYGIGWAYICTNMNFPNPAMEQTDFSFFRPVSTRLAASLVGTGNGSAVGNYFGGVRNDIGGVVATGHDIVCGIMCCIILMIPVCFDRCPEPLQSQPSENPQRAFVQYAAGPT